MSLNFRQQYQVMMDHSKVSRKHFWMIQTAKIEVFSRYLELGLLVGHDIACCDSNKCSWAFGNDSNSSCFKDWRWAHGLPCYSSQRQLRLGLVLLGSSSVTDQDSWRTLLRIFLIFGLNVPYHKGKKRTRRFCQEKSGSFKNLRC